MARSSKDIAKRLRFDHRPRPDFFRRRYFVVGLIAILLGIGAWMGLGATVGERQYLPGPLTPSHATFGDRCAHCHVAFASAPDEKCVNCHAPRVHSEFEPSTPPCRDCHIEHRSEDLLVTLSGRECVDCHAALVSTREPMIHAAIATFRDHPELTPLRPGQGDPTKLRFNHKLHLTSDRVNEKLQCAQCHVLEADGRYMQPLLFETHCKRCHELKVTEGIPSPINQVEAPHEDPPTVRDALIDKLLALGAKRADGIFVGNETILLPGRESRGPVDQSKDLMAFQQRWTEKIEAGLYKPFVDAPPLLDNNKQCFLCHTQGQGTDPAGFVIVEEPSRPPARWMMRGEFSHRRHDKVACETCHPNIRESELTGDVNLPGKAVCFQCHADDQPQSAGTECLLCHLYHDTSKDHAKRAAAEPVQKLEKLLGQTP